MELVMKCKKQLKNYSAENEEKELKRDCPILRENFEKTETSVRMEDYVYWCTDKDGSKLLLQVSRLCNHQANRRLNTFWRRLQEKNDLNLAIGKYPVNINGLVFSFHGCRI